MLALEPASVHDNRDIKDLLSVSAECFGAGYR